MRNIIITTHIKEQLALLRSFQQYREDLRLKIDCGIITADDATREELMITKKERELKKSLVEQVHIKNNGTPRKIEYKENTGLWKTLLPDKTPVTATTEDIIYDKLMTYYGLSITDYSLSALFKEAIVHKDKTEPVNPDTLSYLESSFKRFIDDSIGNMDIRKITLDVLSEYTLNMLRKAQEPDSQGVTHKIKKKAFLSYKSVLNLAFDYAMLKDYITANPLDKFKNKAFLKECDCNKSLSEEKIFSEDEIEAIKTTVRKYMTYERYNGYFINGYAILLSIETGMRAGELPSLKWTDVHDNYIHIHTQQLAHKREGGKQYYLVDYTKNEKGVSCGGRKFPLTQEIKSILDELKTLQEKKEIHSDFIFCHEDGEWIKKDAYITCLRRMLSSMGFKVTNNHAFRMSLNSNVLDAKLHLPVAKRAELLGHSVETNLKYYTYASKQDMDDLVDLFDADKKEHPNFVLLSPRSHLKSVNF